MNQKYVIRYFVCKTCLYSVHCKLCLQSIYPSVNKLQKSLKFYLMFELTIKLLSEELAGRQICIYRYYHNHLIIDFDIIFGDVDY